MKLVEPEDTVFEFKNRSCLQLLQIGLGIFILICLINVLIDFFSAGSRKFSILFEFIFLLITALFFIWTGTAPSKKKEYKKQNNWNNDILDADL